MTALGVEVEVIGAVSHGISKHRVHVLTGIARTTIDDILKRAKS